MKLFLFGLAVILLGGFFTGNIVTVLSGLGIFLLVTVVQLVLWHPMTVNIAFLRDLPPLSLFLFSRSVPASFQKQFGTYKPPAIALDWRSRQSGIALDTKVVGSNEYYVVKPSTEFSSPKQAVEQEVQTMLQMTTVPNTKNIPENFQGVFWMKGNAMQEELAILGLGTWDAENRVLTKISSPGGWSWHDSDGGYFVAKAANEGAWNAEIDAPGGIMMVKFEDDNLEQGRLWSSNSFDYDNVSWLYSLGHFTLEKMNFKDKNVIYKRGCYWGGDGLEIDRGSYTLTRITTLDGTPIQPGYDEYVEYRKNLGVGTLFLKGQKPGGDKKQS